MSTRRCAILAGVLGLSCAGPRERSASGPASPIVSMLDVHREGGRPRYVRWRGAFDRSAESFFAVIGEDGYRALVRTGKTSATVDCDDCGGPLVELEVVSGDLGRDTATLIAIGPVSGALPRARIRRLDAKEPTATWRPTLLVDVDGDGAWDHERIIRCGRYQASGCVEQVCSQWCIGVRRTGASTVDGVSCQGFIPDVEDCEHR